MKRVLERIIPGEYAFYRELFYHNVDHFPVFLLARRSIEYKRYQVIVPGILGILFLIILTKLFAITWAAPD